MALIWRDEHKNPCYSHPHGVDIHGSLLLLSRPRYLHLWADRGPEWGRAVQQCHPETELVLRSAGSWLKGQGTEEEDVVRSERSQKIGTSPPSRGVCLQQFLVHVNKNHSVSDNCCKSRVFYFEFLLEVSCGLHSLDVSGRTLPCLSDT